MKYGFAIALLLLCAGFAQAGILDGTQTIAGTWYEEGSTSLAVAIRVPLDGEGNVSTLLTEYGKDAIKGNVGEQIVGGLAIVSGYAIKHGGVYVVAPALTYDGSGLQCTPALDVRLGLGFQVGPSGRRLHVSACWKPVADGLAPDGVFVGFVWVQ